MHQDPSVKAFWDAQTEWQTWGGHIPSGIQIFDAWNKRRVTDINTVWPKQVALVIDPLKGASGTRVTYASGADVKQRP